MSFPPYPSPAGPNAGGPQPGLYPLRPLRIGEIFGAALRVAWRHLAVLAPIALIFELLSSVALIGLLAANGALHSYATGDYLDLPANPTPAEVSAMLSYVTHNILGALGGDVPDLVDQRPDPRRLRRPVRGDRRDHDRRAPTRRRWPG